MKRGKHHVASIAGAWLSAQRHHGNRALNAFITATVDNSNYVEKLRDAIDCADRFDPRAGLQRDRLDGKLIVLKDNICTLNECTTCASKILQGYQSPFAATVLQRLARRGSITSGKTNLDEFAMGSHSTHSAFGPCRSHLIENDGPLSAGGSSGGSAVAVATNQCFGALGTDTGGSVRLPAAYTGITGFKPSYGRLSRWGVVAYANSLDTVGILAKEAYEVKTIYAQLRAGDIRDPTSISEGTITRLEALSISKRTERESRGQWRHNHRIGVPKEYNIQELEPDVRRTWLKSLQLLRARGHSIHAVSLPTTGVALSSYYVIAAAEASSNLAKYDGVRYGNPSFKAKHSSPVFYSGVRGAHLGTEVKRRILLGSYSLSAGAMDNFFIQAQKVRSLVQKDFNNVFRQHHPLLPPKASDDELEEGVDFLITPTTPSLPPTLESISNKNSVDTFADDVLTVPASLAGLPALTIPVPIDENPPTNCSSPSTVGIQIIGQYGHDADVIEIGDQLSSMLRKASEADATGGRAAWAFNSKTNATRARHAMDVTEHRSLSFS